MWRCLIGGNTIRAWCAGNTQGRPLSIRSFQSNNVKEVRILVVFLFTDSSISFPFSISCNRKTLRLWFHMADNRSVEGSSTGESSEPAVQLNVKTLDSQIYSFHVDKNMPVSVFKGKIANEIGLPVGQQRLIFRGKVLKDEHLLSEYHVENGHTLHLVARHSTQSQPSAGTSSGETNASNGNDASTGVPRNLISQISHSVVLGTLNVGEQGEGVAPDLSRVIGAVLNSFGIGSQPATAGSGNAQASMFSNAPGQAPQEDGTEGTHVNVAGQNQAGNQAHFRHVFPSQQFSPMPQAMQIPLTGAATPNPSLLSPIPDSLSTISEFMNRMELAFSQIGNQPNSSHNARDLPTVELPSNARGLPTPEALSIVLQQAQRLLSDQAVAALSHFSGRLEEEGASADPTTRIQIQTESAQIGLAMQHLGALFLELGRTALMLRMGQSPAESFVNAGPSVYISSLGPNPIMVQPFPLQTSSLFGGSAIPSNPGTVGPAGFGNAPRHINIHIHAGTALAPIISAAGARTNNGEGTQGEHAGRTGSGDSGPSQVLPVRNIFAAAGPTRPTVIATSGAVQPGVGVSISQPPPDSVSPSAAIAELSSRERNIVNMRVENQINELNSRLRNFCVNTRGENQTSSGESESLTAQNSSSGADSGNGVGNNQLSDAVGVNVPVLGGLPQRGDQKTGSHQIGNNEDATDLSRLKDASTCSVESHMISTGETSLKSLDVSDDCVRSSDKLNKPEAAQAVPLGLGLGGLQPKARSRQPKSQVKSSDGGVFSDNQNQDARTSGRQALQSLASHSSVLSRSNANGGQGPDLQSDPASFMSQVIQNPALNGLLSGVSHQTGVGSPDMLRNMLEQFSHSPVMRNAVNQIAQQVDRQDIGNMFSGLGAGQRGGIDLSRMVQEMMPIVSRVLSGGSTLQESFPAAEAEPQPRYNDRRPSRDDKPDYQTSQIDLQQAAERIMHQSPPSDIFRAVAENAGRAYGYVNSPGDLVDELCSDEDLVGEFMQMLHRDVCRRLADNS